MKNFALIASIGCLLTFSPTITQAHQSHHDETQNKHVFHAWWEEKGEDCTIKFDFKNQPNSSTLQVDKGIPINKNQILEVFREVKSTGGLFAAKKYVFHITYKDSNSKVSTSKIIFVDKSASRDFQDALVKFGVI